MKSIITTICLLFCATALFAQTTIQFGINHKLGSNKVQFGAEGSNNLSENFSVTRLEYYMSQFEIVHDGGKITPVKDLYVLVNSFATTKVTLGEFDITTVEAINFSIGVDTPNNHGDPTLWPAEHALAPKLITMHWGWASGYRFVAMEGKAGENLASAYEIHALGDKNYFKQSIPVKTTTTTNGELVIALNADYTKALKDISVAKGLITHGDFEEAITLLTNFRDNVFTSADGVLGTSEIITPGFSVYPNPSKGDFMISMPTTVDQNTTITVWDAMGRCILTNKCTAGVAQLTIGQPGLYYISLSNAQGNLGTTPIIIK